ncbi:MAG: N-acetylmuramoyl-L-alanine amidase [Akkermansia sp.]
MKVAIDIGHANETGARGNRMEEHAVVTVIGEHLRKLLLKAGVQVDVIDYPNRTNEEDLAATVAAINAGDYDLSVSLHCDCSSNESAHGAHVCYCSSTGARVGEAVMFYLQPLMPGRAERLVRRKLMVLTRTRCPAILVECGFISHQGDAKKLRDEPARIADAIAAGIQEWMRDNS